jgi:hypothetical protein
MKDEYTNFFNDLPGCLGGNPGACAGIAAWSFLCTYKVQIFGLRTMNVLHVPVIGQQV